jgi:hypothetical protein
MSISEDHSTTNHQNNSAPARDEVEVLDDIAGLSGDHRLQQTALPQECSALLPVFPPAEFP